jgi:serine/threonine protein phosphatase PrpC
VVATHQDPYSSHYRDLQMTRSICDWTKSSWVLPQPQLLRFDVPAGKHMRAVLASDGLWDVCTVERAAEVVRAARTIDEAAAALLAIAKEEYLGNRALPNMGDDTMVMVLELNPSLLARPASTGSCPDCGVM